MISSYHATPNKQGFYKMYLLAKYHKVPFYTTVSQISKDNILIKT